MVVLRDGLRERAALEQPRPGPQALAVTRADVSVFALRRIVIEFGPAELIDSVAVRPLTFYMGPLMFGNVIAGWIFGKLASDVAFYLCAVLTYERFKGLLVQRARRCA